MLIQKKIINDFFEYTDSENALSKGFNEYKLLIYLQKGIIRSWDLRFVKKLILDCQNIEINMIKTAFL